MRPKGITLRIALLGWVVTLVTLGVFVIASVPAQKHEFALNLESKARGIAVSMKGVAAGAAVSEDYSVVVDQSMQILSEDPAIAYLVMTKNDGFSVITDRSNWRIDQLSAFWHPSERVASSSIGTVPLFGRRVFHFAFPFDYSGIQWGWIHVGLSLESYDQGVRRTYERTGGLALLCGALSLLISLVYAKRLVKPIHTLHSAVERVAHGDLHARAEVHSEDEVERLADAFNGMATTIHGRNQILESVSFAAKQLLSAKDPDMVAGEVLERVGHATGASRACLFRSCEANGVSCLALHKEWPQAAHGREESSDGLPWNKDGQAYWVELLGRGKIVALQTAELDPNMSMLADPAPRSVIFIPIVVAGEWWGVIGIEDSVRQRDWGEAERDSLRAVADMMGAAIARRRVQDALVEAKETLEQRVIERTSELQEAQQQLAQNLERLDLALDCAEEALWDWNVLENRTFYSERWSRMLGFSQEEIGQSVEIWRDLVHPDDFAVAAEKLRLHMEGHSESYQAEFRMRTKSGGWRWIRARGKLVARGADGSPLRVTGTHLDITANKQAEDALIELSREAGMAEIATGVLHNVGNVLNSVNVSTSVVAGKIRESRVDNLVAVLRLLEQHANDLPEFLGRDPKGQRALPYLMKLGEHLRSERDGLLTELELLASHVGHIKNIVATQQSYAKVSGLVEHISLAELVEDALRIMDPGLGRDSIKVKRDFESLPAIAAEKHKILQILLNLFRNARQAILQAQVEIREIRITIRRPAEGLVILSVGDTGVGLPPENLTRIFGHGFTTKADGHGFGLHSCALAARQMGGSLRAESEGVGRGAIFILELPLKLAPDTKDNVSHELTRSA